MSDRYADRIKARLEALTEEAITAEGPMPTATLTAHGRTGAGQRLVGALGGMPQADDGEAGEVWRALAQIGAPATWSRNERERQVLLGIVAREIVQGGRAEGEDPQAEGVAQGPEGLDEMAAAMVLRPSGRLMVVLEAAHEVSREAWEHALAGRGVRTGRPRALRAARVEGVPRLLVEELQGGAAREAGPTAASTSALGAAAEAAAVVLAVQGQADVWITCTVGGSDRSARVLEHSMAQLVGRAREAHARWKVAMEEGLLHGA